MDQNGLKKTKIVATVAGGASEDFLRSLMEAGMDVVRLNSAHMTVNDLAEMVRRIRCVSPKLAIMLDTKGPNIRTCGIAAEIPLRRGDQIAISGVPGEGRIAVNYPAFAEEVPTGVTLVCDDGAAAFRVINKKDDTLIAEAMFDCIMRDKKSINVPNVELNPPSLTEKDRMFLAAAVELGVDWIAHSFVRNAEDIKAVRAALGDAGSEIGIVAKIENRQGVRNLQEILLAADGVMVARGDLGIEIPLEEVPAIQKAIIHAAMSCAKPVITATQMLQSMETSPVPTRAEVSDVANAVYDGTDAVMLSGETAHGQFPREAVAVMKRIILEAEKAPRQYFTRLIDVPESGSMQTKYILRSAVHAADFLPVKAIICSTLRGISARLCSAMRPKVLIYAPTPDEKTMRRLALSYGVVPLLSEFQDSVTQLHQHTLQVVAKSPHGLQDEDLVVMLDRHSNAASRNNLCCIATWGEMLQ